MAARESVISLAVQVIFGGILMPGFINGTGIMVYLSTVAIMALAMPLGHKVQRFLGRRRNGSCRHRQ
jgi:hypothetical protein